MLALFAGVQESALADVRGQPPSVRIFDFNEVPLTWCDNTKATTSTRPELDICDDLGQIFRRKIFLFEKVKRSEI